MVADVDTIVIGAGVIGLAIARAVALSGREVMVLERHDRIGSETSSRNSEVIHAGLYYPPGSLRARLCVAGKQQLYAYCDSHGVAAKRCGKLLVATREEELPRLDAIAATSAANGVDDIVRLNGAGARELEPEVSAIAALLSPSTGVIDSHGLMQALDGDISSNDGSVVLNTRVLGVSRDRSGHFVLRTESGGEVGEISAARLVISAGHGATELADSLFDGMHGTYRAPRTYPAKGHYFSLSGRQPFRRLIYPMPSGAWLGVHLTLDISGRAKFGPDIAWVENVDYSFEDADGSRRASFEREIRRYWPGLPDGALMPDYTGVRPKIYREGEPAADFAIHGPATHGVAGLVALYGMESPGLTSSLAVADEVVALLSDTRPA